MYVCTRACVRVRVTVQSIFRIAYNTLMHILTQCVIMEIVPCFGTLAK